MTDNNSPDFAHGRKNKGGRPFGALTKVRRDLPDWARKDGKQAFENLKHLALHGEHEFVRLAATKEWLDRGFGKPVAADGENAGAIAQINVITGVREGSEWERIGPGPPPSRPLLPDRRDPFEQPPPSGSRPIGRAPVSEPPCTARLTEGPLKERN